MLSFYFLLFIIVIGFAVIGFVLLIEKKKESSPEEEPKPTLAVSPQPSVLPKEILERVAADTQKAKTAASTSPTAESTKVETELSLKIDELQNQLKGSKEKYEKLDLLFQEKSSKLEKTEKSLTTEQKNQKEFHKLQDLLEKEIKDTKEKTKALQADLASSQTETQLQIKRVSQLEEKIKKLEASVLSSEAAVKDAQAGTQLAHKTIEELEIKLKEKDNHIIEKNQKIEHLVEKIKDLTPKPVSETSAEVRATTPAETQPEKPAETRPEPPAETPDQTLPEPPAETPEEPPAPVENTSATPTEPLLLEKQGGEPLLINQMEHTPPQLPSEQTHAILPVEPAGPPAQIPTQNPEPAQTQEESLPAPESEPKLKLRPDNIVESPQEEPPEPKE